MYACVAGMQMSTTNSLRNRVDMCMTVSMGEAVSNIGDGCYLGEASNGECSRRLLLYVHVTCLVDIVIFVCLGGLAV